MSAIRKTVRLNPFEFVGLIGLAITVALHLNQAAQGQPYDGGTYFVWIGLLVAGLVRRWRGGCAMCEGGE